MARHACQDAGELELVGICSGAWCVAQVARNIGARSAILVNLLVWNWRVTPTLLSQWGYRKITLNTNAPGDTGGGVAGPGLSASEHFSTRLGSRRRTLCTTTSRDTSCGC